ncbi:MAG: hypothetical protein K0S93_961 [Nitrososphaeraceae archaeon]|jgi:hypothetical protein|nr:hypothetical protein [Nitrososphaeraceae archaeon]
MISNILIINPTERQSESKMTTTTENNKNNLHTFITIIFNDGN